MKCKFDLNLSKTKPQKSQIVNFAQNMGQITFQFEQKDLAPLTVEIFEGETVLEVALDNNIALNHNCGGVCGCSTCHVYVNSGEDMLPEMSEREEDYVDRARNPKYNSRLACQCKLEEDGNLTVTIPDQSGIIGH
jgi:2Fe-2S ferredoxin